jgi:hypothetical protein
VASFVLTAITVVALMALPSPTPVAIRRSKE